MQNDPLIILALITGGFGTTLNVVPKVSLASVYS